MINGCFEVLCGNYYSVKYIVILSSKINARVISEIGVLRAGSTVNIKDTLLVQQIIHQGYIPLTSKKREFY